MNNDAVNNTNNQHVAPDNEATPYAADFSAAAPVATAAISPYAHFLSSGLKLDTELFSKGSINNMAYKDTINTTPVPNAPDSDTPDASAQYAGSTDSSSPYSLINRKFKKEKKIYDKVTISKPTLSSIIAL